MNSQIDLTGYDETFKEWFRIEIEKGSFINLSYLRKN